MINTKKLFGTDGIRGEFGKFPLNKENITQLGKVIGEKFEGEKILIGRDTRESGKEIEEYLIESLISQGAEIYLLGIVPTPGVSFLVKKLKLDFAIMITASHNPYQDNGIKFFNEKGLKLTDLQEEEIENIFFSNKVIENKKEGIVFDFKNKVNDYSNFLKKSV